MYWIALQPSPDELRRTWGWRGLQFTPRVAELDEALLLEASASERLFGGRRALLRQLLKGNPDLAVPAWADGPTALQALAVLRLKRARRAKPELLPDDLPLDTLTAARPHLPTLERIGCTTFGQLRSLPRAGVSRRFGAAVLQAVDAMQGQRPERYPWLTLPQDFDEKLELQSLATSAQELLFTGQHLLTLLQAWLQARNLGVLALELEWTLDLRRLDGKPLPPTEKMELRTAQPTQDMHHLRRLASEQLARSSIAAPANHLRLRTLQTVPWGGTSTSLLPEDNKPGEKLHQLVERLSVRLGEGNVTMLQARADHRPECMQDSVRAASLHAGAAAVGCAASPRTLRALPVRSEAAHPTKAGSVRNPADPLFPPWLLRQPLRLQVKADKPLYQGPLQLLTRARRLEAAWWDPSLEQPVLRDYFIARSESVGLLWVFRERLSADQDRAQWFLHGIYA
ncbi:MAG TPA: DNA polymerase Y family protein [Ramlibacter sp.]|jgi:protein ImuB